MTEALEDMQKKKKGRHGGPLAEVDFWRERATSVCALYDQFNAPAIAPVLDVFAKLDSSMELLRHDIGKLYEEANDITRSAPFSIFALRAGADLRKKASSATLPERPPLPSLLLPPLPSPPLPSPLRSPLLHSPPCPPFSSPPLEEPFHVNVNPAPKN